MAYFIALGILTLAGIVGTVWLVRTDGYGRIPTDPSRVVSPERTRTARIDAAPGVEAARPSLSVPAPRSAPATAPLRVVAAD